MSHKFHIRFAQFLSLVFHPLFIPTYGMLLYMWYMLSRASQLPGVYVGLTVIGTFVLTAFIPMMLILLLWRRKVISSPLLTEAAERTTPYVYTTISYGFWIYFLRFTMRLPHVWFYIAIGTTVALLLVTIINRRWKISAHLTALGGLLGGICSLALYYAILPFWSIVGLLLLSLLVMYARLSLNAHTPMQVVAGYMLGLLCTITPNLILYHA